MFVLPAIRTLMGLHARSRGRWSTPGSPAAMTSPEGRRQFMRGRAGIDAQGRYVEPVGGPGSHLIGALAEADCLIVVPEEVTALGPGRPGAGADAGRGLLMAEC